MKLTIRDVAFGGDGVAEAPDGRLMFIPFTAPGETVEAEIVSTHRRFGRAVVRDILTPSPERTTAPCPLFGRCGGCAYQHLTYPAQAALKQKQARDVLSRLGGLRDLPPFTPAISGTQPFEYRNKMRLEPVPSAAGSGDQPGYGFFALDNKTVLPLTECPLALPALNRLLAEIPRNQPVSGIRRNQRPPALTLRVSARGETGYYFSGGEASGWTTLTEQIAGRDIKVPLTAFWQVNPPVAESLLQTVVGWITEQPEPVLVDAYGGIGAFSLALGQGIQKRIVIEADPVAATAALENHRLWGLEEPDVYPELTEQVLPQLLLELARDRQRATVILDPPRTGCEPAALQALCEQRNLRLCYVSCNPATLARDLKVLTAGGYRLRHLAWFDMFPQTAHFELAVSLERE